MQKRITCMHMKQLYQICSILITYVYHAIIYLQREVVYQTPARSVICSTPISINMYIYIYTSTAPAQHTIWLQSFFNCSGAGYPQPDIHFGHLTLFNSFIISIPCRHLLINTCIPTHYGLMAYDTKLKQPINLAFWVYDIVSEIPYPFVIS